MLFYQKLYPSVRAMLKPAAPVVETQNDNGVRPKITDRVGQPGAQQVAPVAQRVVLYDEDPSSPQGKQYVGSVIWRTEAVKAPAGQPADVGVRADIDVPERKFKMSLSIRRNTDASLPASHTAELTFNLPPDFGATVANVPGILMKSNEQARGTPLAGLAVKVTDGFFLVGLSKSKRIARASELLKERSWFEFRWSISTNAAPSSPSRRVRGRAAFKRGLHGVGGCRDHHDRGGDEVTLAGSRISASRTFKMCARTASTSSASWSPRRRPPRSRGVARPASRWWCRPRPS